MQRWEQGGAAPGAQATEALVGQCRELGLFRAFAGGPLTGLTLTPELLRELLAEARCGAVAPTAGAGAPSAGAERPPRPPARPPTNLPLQVTSFVGREQEMAEVGRWLGLGRLVTLSGPGGGGKTRLGARGRGRGAGRVPGRGVAGRAGGAGRRGAGAPGRGRRGGRPGGTGSGLLATLVEALRPKRLLLVLDNSEHLAGACARLVEALLRACPQVRILATTREVLGVAGEATWRVPPLAVPETRPPPPPERLLQYGAVRLFLDRAAAVQPGLVVTDRTAVAVAAICRRLDGLPLALELAAARVRVLPVEQLLARLEDRFRLLTGGSRTVPERHQTLRASVDWSYGLLVDRERTLFNRLSVFAGGWSLEAAEAVGADGGRPPRRA